MEIRTTLSNKSDPALQSIRDVFCSREDSDVRLVCDDKVTVKAHKFLLGFHSSVFKSLLQNVDESPAFIFLPETKSEDLEMMLNLLYFRSVPDHLENNQYLLEIMNRFNIDIPDVEIIKQELVETEETDEVAEHTETIEELVSHEISAKDPFQDFMSQEKVIDQSFSENFETEESVEESQDFTMMIEDDEFLNSSERLETEESHDITMILEENYSEADNSSEQIEKSEELKPEDNDVEEFNVKKYKHERAHFCSKCQMIFTSVSDLKEHYETKKHNEIKSKCKVCKKLFVNEMMLKIHMEEHQKKPVLTQDGRLCCNKCDKSFKDLYKLRNHKVIHVQGMLSCLYCPSQFSNYHSLKWHLEHPDGEFVECDLCGKKIKGKFRLNEHKLAFHQGLRLKCNFCERGFTDSSNLSKHVQADHFGRRFNCEQCGYSAKKRSALRIHIDAEHPSENSQLYNCPDCRFQSFSIDRLKHHRAGCRRRRGKTSKTIT